MCIQHEMDHLVGKVFVDYLSPLKRARLTGRLRKKQRLRLTARLGAAPPQGRLVDVCPRRQLALRVGFAGTPAFAAAALAAIARAGLHDTARA